MGALEAEINGVIRSPLHVETDSLSRGNDFERARRQNDFCSRVRSENTWHALARDWRPPRPRAIMISVPAELAGTGPKGALGLPHRKGLGLTVAHDRVSTRNAAVVRRVTTSWIVASPMLARHSIEHVDDDEQLTRRGFGTGDCYSGEVTMAGTRVSRRSRLPGPR